MTKIPLNRSLHVAEVAKQVPQGRIYWRYMMKRFNVCLFSVLVVVYSMNVFGQTNTEIHISLDNRTNAVIITKPIENLDEEMKLSKIRNAASILEQCRLVSISTRKTQFIFQKRNDPRLPSERYSLSLESPKRIIFREGGKISLGGLTSLKGDIIKVDNMTGEVLIRNENGDIISRIFPTGILTDTCARVVNLENQSMILLREGDTLMNEWIVLNISSNNSIIVSNIFSGTSSIKILSDSERTRFKTK